MTTPPIQADADILFYVFDERCVRQILAPLPAECVLMRWRPTVRQLIPPGTQGLKWLVWAAFHYGGVFKTADYSVIRVRQGSELVHRSSLFPKYWRFPFMRGTDLQLGDTWTAPAARGRGFAAAALHAGVDVAQSQGARLWYLTTRSNHSSISVAQRVGLRCAGVGRRRSRFGVRALGTFELTAAHGPDSD